eukprot:TRINITY_DN1577_c0_g1_i5.p1 TRINITY_DN1577_c0_g1~~TRINITY_DN1577_c0_g1_i5.p1  ORF type:complete len:545 (-),score=76.46 TRINITY_DN1577_c0_g1_i5:62-1696(-)
MFAIVFFPEVSVDYVLCNFNGGSEKDNLLRPGAVGLPSDFLARLLYIRAVCGAGTAEFLAKGGFSDTQVLCLEDVFSLYVQVLRQRASPVMEQWTLLVLHIDELQLFWGEDNALRTQTLEAVMTLRDFRLSASARELKLVVVPILTMTEPVSGLPVSLGAIQSLTPALLDIVDALTAIQSSAKTSIERTLQYPLYVFLGDLGVLPKLLPECLQRAAQLVNPQTFHSAVQSILSSSLCQSLNFRLSVTEMLPILLEAFQGTERQLDVPITDDPDTTPRLLGRQGVIFLECRSENTAVLRMTPLQLHQNRKMRWPGALGELFPDVPFMEGVEQSERNADRLFEIDTLRLILLRLLLLAHTRPTQSTCRVQELFCGARGSDAHLPLPAASARGPFLIGVQESFWKGKRQQSKLDFERLRGYYELRDASIRNFDSWITIPGARGQKPALIVIQNKRKATAGTKTEPLKQLNTFFGLATSLRSQFPAAQVFMLWVTNRDPGFEVSESEQFPPFGCYYITAESIAQFLPLLTHRYQPEQISEILGAAAKR